MVIQRIRLTGQRLAESITPDGQYVYTVYVDFVPSDIVDGRQSDINGLPLEVMRSNGWKSEARIDLVYPATSDGGSPSLEQTSTAVKAWLGAELLERMQMWVGRSVIIEVTDHLEG